MKPVVLCILDGFGHREAPEANAISLAHKTTLPRLFARYPFTTLLCSGLEVGLPEGQMGNSEVGHTILGGGRVVYQDLPRISKAIRDGDFFVNPELVATVEAVKARGGTLHVMGLTSPGGIHSTLEHGYAVVELARRQGLARIAWHAFLDGRDTPPDSATGYVRTLLEHPTFAADSKTRATIASVSGRYYVMDRDKRWERVKLAYDALVNGEGQKATDAIAAVEQSYIKNITDEFILPTVIVSEDQQPIATIKNGDVALCFNFRTDRCREITQVLTQTDNPQFLMYALDLHYTTMTRYEHSYKNVHVIFEKEDLTKTLGEIISEKELKQIRIAETEKYPHVTFFFSGGREKEFEGEKRMMCQSPKVATYDLQPEMSANELTAVLLPEIKKEEASFICLNYANTDMVGHTGVFAACIKAAETVDHCVEQIVNVGLQHGYTIFLTADHGNSDFEINADGSPNTQHSLNPVPLFIIDKDFKGNIKPGKLGDIAPTILTMMGINIPKEMTGEILIK